MSGVYGSALKNLLKGIAYPLFRQSLPEPERLTLAYIFHTESLFDDAYFGAMRKFVKDYEVLTGKRALATLMSGAHPRARDGARSRGLSEHALADRFREIGEMAELGYHGHFAVVPDKYEDPEMQIRGAAYDIRLVCDQVDSELKWFSSMNLQIGPYYSGGWWFQAPELYRLLADRGFKLDASVSYSPWFKHQNTYTWFRSAGVRVGEPVMIDDKILAVQNLIGCHNTPFPDDFIRNVRALLVDPPPMVHAFVHSHDFDLHPEYTLSTLARLRDAGVRFASAKDFLDLSKNARHIAFP